ncbi:hypothetical protein HYH03_014043 [Edaphochlamys debaryana]|uniref:Procollagen-proline 4-dioxygenase n=1 Tax=Edaphochlamys debaryana TaxID=47281 RepID=A0A835XSA0_9CHLO|nr:hypothetical protein HYH03_014043 [Edaphochlamys debaryana]|eukprot:KAG2487326.1 hypothetical protein HYH03_014043 [Edaphochlamys debaryana]
MRRRSAFLLLLLRLTLGLALNDVEDEERLIGWKGETYGQNEDRWGLASDDASPNHWVETVSWSPRVFIYHGFLTDAEARHIKRTAAPMMKRSSVVGSNGSSVLDTIRTSYGTFVRRRHDPVIERVLRRVASWTKAPPENQEDLQVLRYGIGQKYGAHMDSLIDDSPRMATVLLYLHDTEEGGETAFPDSGQWLDPALPDRLGPFSKCAQGKVAFRPKKGDALMFWSIKPDGTHDPLSLHTGATGCPVVRGVKWTATSWVHSMPYNYDDFFKTKPDDDKEGEPGACMDLNDQCVTWAESGECDRNPVYMNAHCVRACKRCEPCASTTDWECINRNREKLGFMVYDQDELDA